MKEKLKFKLDSIPARFGGGFSKPDISAPFGMRCATGTTGVPPVALRVEKWNGGKVEWCVE